MIEKTLYFKCRPSQIINLDTFLLTILVVPVVILINMVVDQSFQSILIPEELEVHLVRLPIYLSVLALINLAYQILRVYCITYEIDSEELRHYSGIFRRKHEFIELYRVKDFKIEKPLIYRPFGLGDLTLYTSDKTTPVFKLEGIRKPEEKYQTIRGLVEQNRKIKHVFEVD